MIDFVKLRINDNGFSQRLRENPLFDFVVEINPDTGEQKDGRRTAKFKNLKIVLFPSGLVEITGSLHKFANNGEHNYDSFTYQRLVHTIEEVAAGLEILPGCLNLHNVEFGININLDTSPSNFLDSILNYRFKLPDIRTFGGKGKLKEWQQQNYIVKVYDKKKQYRLYTNVLRFEVKTIAMIHLKSINIRTLADLLDVEKLKRLGVILSDTYKGLMIGEKLDKSQMSRSELRVYKNGMNPNFWYDLNERRKRNYYRKQFEQVIRKYGLNVGEKVYQLIEEKIEELLIFTEHLSDSSSQKLGHFTASNKEVKYPINLLPLHHSLDTYKRHCKVCGTPIEHRRKDAIFCEKKKCRNKDSNLRNNFKRRLMCSMNYSKLFEFKDVFKPFYTIPEQQDIQDIMV